VVFFLNFITYADKSFVLGMFQCQGRWRIISIVLNECYFFQE